jgi:hypothetical protein
MAHFRAQIQGNRGDASRLGHKSSGIRARADGWNRGAYVYGAHDEALGDVFTIHDTKGSKSGIGDPIARIVEMDNSIQIMVRGEWVSLDWIERNLPDSPMSAEEAEELNEKIYSARYDEMRI